MPRTWANSGLDLHVELGRTRVRESLERALRDSVESGRLLPGTLLPPSRTLAADLGIARNTVVEAYAQLVAEGWLKARQGSGTLVAEQATTSYPTASTPGRGTAPARYDLRPGYPDLSGFPQNDWLASARSALAEAPAEAFGYGDPRGRPELRTALASYLGRARGVRASAETVVVCSGFSQALFLLATVLRGEGRSRVALECYGHRRHREILAGAGLDVATLELDGQGARPVALEGLDAVLLTPAHQFPLGVALEATRRTSFLQWAAASGAVVIEDDYDGEFRYDRRAVGAMQALSPDQVVYAGTASKTLAPGLRLGWLVLPPRLVEAVVEQRRLSDIHTAVIDQLTLAEFVASGRYDRHVRRSRLAYRRRRDLLVAALAHQVPDVAVRGLPAGLHAIVELAPGTSEAEAVAEAQARSLALDGLSSYALGASSAPPALVVGYATPPPHAYTGALARLCASLGGSLDNAVRTARHAGHADAVRELLEGTTGE
jgi:GntR family transcriptional regulator/MocR family aminotransferase